MDEKNLNQENEEINEQSEELSEEVTEEIAEDPTIDSETESEIEETVTESQEDSEVEESITEENVTDEEEIQDYDDEYDFSDQRTEYSSSEEQPETGFVYEGDMPEAEEKPKKSSLPIIIVIILVILALIVGTAIVMVRDKNTNNLSSLFNKNPYNPMNYPSIEGSTIGDIAEMYGVELSEFLSVYGLPADMPADTPSYSSEFYIPCEIFAQMNGYENFEALKTAVNIPDETTVSEPKTFFDKIKSIFSKEEPQPITGDTYWGIALDEMTLGSYVGEENIGEFKEQFGLGDDINVETKYKEVRPVVEDYIRTTLQEQAAQMENSAEENADETSETEITDSADTEESSDNTESDANTKE